MALTGKQVKNTYQGLLILNSNNQGLTTTAQSVKDGLDIASPLSLATDKVLIHGNAYPAGSGVTGQVITTDGAGELSWSTVLTEVSGDVKYARLNSENNFTAPNNFFNQRVAATNSAFSNFDLVVTNAPLNQKFIRITAALSATSDDRRGALTFEYINDDYTSSSVGILQQFLRSGNVATQVVFYINNIDAAYIDPAGTSTPSTKTIITREKGDARYAQLNQTVNFTSLQLGNISNKHIFFDGVQNGIRGIAISVSGVLAGIIQPAGTSTPSTTTIITREKGDVRYAQISAFNIFSERQRISATIPTFDFYETDQAVDNKTWRLVGSNGEFGIQTVNDTYTVASEGYKLARTGNSVTSHNFYVGGVNTATITNTGTTSPLLSTIITREKGDARYTQISSDENLKENIIGAVSALPLIEALRPVMYNFKADASAKQHFGLIAQEVQQVLPNAVLQGGEGLGLELKDLVGLLIKANQELNTKLNDALARINILEGN